MIKNIVIGLFAIICISISLEKKSAIDDLKNELDILEGQLTSGNVSLNFAQQKINLLEGALSQCDDKLAKHEKDIHNVTVTMYQPVQSQTDDTPNITADGTVIKVDRASEYRYVAVSQNMLIKNGGFLNFGDYVWVDAGKKSGVYQVRDVMNRRFTDRIDILEGVDVRPYKYDNARMVKLVYAD